MTNGYQNEFLFVLEFNNKKIKNLNPLLREIIDDLFPNSNEESVIKSWTNHYKRQKADILIKIDNQTKYISIKKGSRNSIHVEYITHFLSFLKKMGLNDYEIQQYKNFHYGIDKNNDELILNSHDYCEQNKESIKNINEALKRIDFDELINRFLLFGINSRYSIDGLIYGTPDDFFWINTNEIREILRETKGKKSSSVHIGELYIQPMNRCINNNPKYIWCKNYVQIKWYSLFDDIIKYKCKN